MASRSFKPASYLASAAQQAPNRSPRPSFTRTSSSSSTTSEDSLLATLRSMKVVDKGGEGSAAAVFVGSSSSSHISGYHTSRTESASSSLSSKQYPDTPGRMRSQPIAIELPHKEQVYTPLSARGDLPGGYFPNYEEVPRVYRSHPFGESQAKSKAESPIMSASSSLMSSPASETTPRGPMGLMSPVFGPLSPSIPEPLIKPMGKYHPANYKSPCNTQVTTPTSAPRLLPPTNLSIPVSSKRHVNSKRPTHGHERKNSDVKRKLQQYQRDMIAQARSAASTSITSTMNGVKKEPNSPRLLPAGSPGPITPFELEDIDNEGYITAGHRARSNQVACMDRDRQDTMNVFQQLRS